jgi:hypothetical protein
MPHYGEGIMHKPLPTTKMKTGVRWIPAEINSPKPISIDSPAIEVMTDLQRVHAVTVATGETITRATRLMIARRIRLLLVVNADGLIEGLISARDTMGEKPVKLLQERRNAKYEELTVGDLMVPRHQIDVLDIETVLRANVGAIIATLKEFGRQHALVLETDPVRGIQIVRGIFSATQIARQLGVAIPILGFQSVPRYGVKADRQSGGHNTHDTRLVCPAFACAQVLGTQPVQHIILQQSFRQRGTQLLDRPLQRRRRPNDAQPVHPHVAHAHRAVGGLETQAVAQVETALVLPARHEADEAAARHVEIHGRIDAIVGRIERDTRRADTDIQHIQHFTVERKL